MPHQPIAVISRKRVCKNAVFTVYLDHIRSESGCEVTDYLSVEPLHLFAGKISGIAMLPVVDDQIGLIPLFRHPLGQSGWEIPRGFVDKNLVGQGKIIDPCTLVSCLKFLLSHENPRVQD